MATTILYKLPTIKNAQNNLDTFKKNVHDEYTSLKKSALYKAHIFGIDEKIYPITNKIKDNYAAKHNA